MMLKVNFTLIILLQIFSGSLWAARVSDVANTAHNLSISSTGNVKATNESQICVFCHTPHNAEDIPAAPLWNRKLSQETYVPYSSESMDAVGLGQPGGSSKLCLSCHDGTLALGAVNVLNGQANVTIQMSGIETDGSMPAGSGEQTGFTRRLGLNLSNDHPISFNYDSSVASSDGELRDPVLVSHIADRSPGVKPVVPLENGQVQCISCHDPHIRDDSNKNIKFLRLNRFQLAAPVGGNFDQASDILCLACHDKLGQAWATSAHADPNVANEIYTDTAAAQRDFPLNSQVWEISCLNCHDTHTVQGANRLLREGTDSVNIPKSGGASAIEETCYQCHSNDGTVLQGQGGTGFVVPDIKSDFLLPRHMPITNIDQPAGSEQHAIINADFSESTLSLGKGNPNNRHAECPDCHNPHRLVKNQLFNNTGATTVGTHQHDPLVQHTNIASGVLRGGWGVEPVYGSTLWGAVPTQYLVKQGDGGDGASTLVTSNHLTREYQNCLKCHSDYAYDFPPNLGDSGGGTPANTNMMLQYTNQAMEFQSPIIDQGETGGNHRSWHPVMNNTGRTLAIRGNATPGLWLDPWSGPAGAFIGNQTMYCTDCHGSATIAGTSEPAGGIDGSPWGPHGSTNDFILKGNWNNATGTGQPGDLCFKCHDYLNYADPTNLAPSTSGFNNGQGGNTRNNTNRNSSVNLHVSHAQLIGAGVNNPRLECTWCHVAVPHGWKNKSLLADISQEGGIAPYTMGPYFLEAMLGGGGAVTWAVSGTWNASNCGGRQWMRNSCSNPP